MAITVMLKVSVNDINKLSDLLKEYLPQTRKYEGFIDISIYSETNSNNVIFYSKWNKIEDYESYFKWRVETGVLEKLSEVFEDEPSVKFYNTLDV